mgnify:CR=1
MRLFLINFLIGLLVAFIANGKGHSFFKWWINGAIFGPFALLYVLFMERRFNEGKSKNLITCPHCRKMIPADAAACPVCHQNIDIIDV